MDRKLFKLSWGDVRTEVFAILFMMPALVLAEGFNDYQDAVFADVEQRRGLPVRGTTTKTVLDQYGEPAVRKGPVGNPPISVWHYDSFDVYFEEQLVITTVDKEDVLPVELDGIAQ